MGYWGALSLRQKIGLFKQIAIELIIIAIGSLVFFWGSLIFLWLFSLMISPSPYYYELNPIYHIRQFNQESLVTVLVNEELK